MTGCDYAFTEFLLLPLEHRVSVKRSVLLLYRQSVGGIGPSHGRYCAGQQSEVRTHDPSVLAEEDISCFRPSDHCDRR
jgi:hypothetical protein